MVGLKAHNGAHTSVYCAYPMSACFHVLLTAFRVFIHSLAFSPVSLIEASCFVRKKEKESTRPHTPFVSVSRLQHPYIIFLKCRGSTGWVQNSGRVEKASVENSVLWTCFPKWISPMSPEGWGVPWHLRKHTGGEGALLPPPRFFFSFSCGWCSHGQHGYVGKFCAQDQFGFGCR